MTTHSPYLILSALLLLSLLSGQSHAYTNCYNYAYQKQSTATITLPALEACEFNIASPRLGTFAVTVRVNFTTDANIQTNLYECPPTDDCSNSPVISGQRYVFKGNLQSSYMSTFLFSNMESTDKKFSVEVVYPQNNYSGTIQLLVAALTFTMACLAYLLI